MDSQRFDAMTRELATSTTRRGLLKGAVGGSAMAALWRSGATARAATTCASGDQGIVYAIILAVVNALRSIGIPLPLPTPPNPVECTGSAVLNPDTCECECHLTALSDCPGGVDQAACACIPIICEVANTPCGVAELDCDCIPDVVTGELTCIDHGGPNNHPCETAADCPAPGMICARDDENCYGDFCYPPCGQAPAFSHIPNNYA